MIYTIDLTRSITQRYHQVCEAPEDKTTATDCRSE